MTPSGGEGLEVCLKSRAVEAEQREGALREALAALLSAGEGHAVTNAATASIVVTHWSEDEYRDFCVAASEARAALALTSGTAEERFSVQEQPPDPTEAITHAVFALRYPELPWVDGGGRNVAEQSECRRLALRIRDEVVGDVRMNTELDPAGLEAAAMEAAWEKYWDFSTTSWVSHQSDFNAGWKANAAYLAGQEQPDEPTRMLSEWHDDVRGIGNASLRLTLHEEEHEELLDELSDKRLSGVRVPKANGDVDRAKLARELADVVYITYGTAHAFAIDLDAALREIHRAAMRKLDSATMLVREDGKILKSGEQEVAEAGGQT